MEIINFDNKYADNFRQLNLEWLNKYNLAEAHDRQILNDPQGTIINSGGYIFLAKEQDAIVGCAGLMKVNEEQYELVKMSVAPGFRGLGISKLLLNHCLSTAKQLKAKKITLLSNHQLERALHLYKQFGFKEIPLDHSPFDLADVKMELELSAE
jgi:putative acetyltransferase